MSRRTDLAKIHIGKKQLGMSDPDYRAFLFSHTGKESSSKLTDRERWRIIQTMEEKGADFTHKGRSRKKPDEFYAIPETTAHARQKRYIAALWKLLGYKMSGLDVRAKKQFDVDKFVWINTPDDLTTMAKDLYNRARKRGLNPEPR